MAVGHLSNRPEASDKGKRALLWSLGGVDGCRRGPLSRHPAWRHGG